MDREREIFKPENNLTNVALGCCKSVCHFTPNKEQTDDKNGKITKSCTKNKKQTNNKQKTYINIEEKPEGL